MMPTETGKLNTSFYEEKDLREEKFSMKSLRNLGLGIIGDASTRDERDEWLNYDAKCDTLFSSSFTINSIQSIQKHKYEMHKRSNSEGSIPVYYEPGLDIYTFTKTEETARKSKIIAINKSPQKHMTSLEQYLDSAVDSCNSLYQETSFVSQLPIIKPDELDEDVICGIGCFKPKWIQSWATERVYLVFYSIVGILHGSYYSYLVGTITTLEKRFAFSSKTSGVIMMVDEAVPLLFGIPIGYLGGKVNRPHLFGYGMILSVVGYLVTALPYFIYGATTHLTANTTRNETAPYLCNGQMQTDKCDLRLQPQTVPAVLLLMLGSFLKGFGNVAYYAIGIAYMDDNTRKENTPIHFAIALALRLVGPLVGYLFSSIFLKFYEDPFSNPEFGPNDPRWIGRWWMGYLLQGMLLFIFTLPIFLFPPRLPGHRKADLKMHYTENENLLSMFDGLFAATKRLATNPVYISLVVNMIMIIFGNFGHVLMLPKYMEAQFRLSASKADIYSGTPVLFAIASAIVAGGYLVWKCKPSIKTLCAGMVALEVINATSYLILMIPKCKKLEMSNFGFSDGGLILSGPCNSICNCSTTVFTPVCGADGKTTYFSPCHAGCSQIFNSIYEAQALQVYRNCSCLSEIYGLQNATVSEGFCVADNCWSQTLAYVITLPILQAITNFLRVANTMVLMRSIDPEDKNIALGAFETLKSVLGCLPYPITFGILVDSACLIWEKNCGETGNCWFYDVEKFNYLIHGSSSFFTLISATSLMCIYFYRDRVRNLYDEEDMTKTS